MRLPQSALKENKSEHFLHHSNWANRNQQNIMCYDQRLAARASWSHFLKSYLEKTMSPIDSSSVKNTSFCWNSYKSVLDNVRHSVWREWGHLQLKTSLLTGSVIIDIVVALAAIDPQKHLIVVVFIPVEWQDPGASALWISTEEAWQTRHQLGERGRASRLEQRENGLQKLLRTLSLQQLCKTQRGPVCSLSTASP